MKKAILKGNKKSQYKKGHKISFNPEDETIIMPEELSMPPQKQVNSEHLS